MFRGPTRKLQQGSIFMLWVFIVLLNGCSRPTTIEAVHQEGVLHVVTRNSPTTYFEGRNGPTGYDFELCQMFADYLNVELKLRIINNLGEAFSVLDQNYTHFAALGLSKHATKVTSDRLRFSSGYMSAQPLVLFKNGNKKPQRKADLVGQRITIAANTAQADQLRQLKNSSLPALEWLEIDGIDTFGLMQMVTNGETDITIVNSVEFAVHKAVFPIARKAFALSGPLRIGWVFPPGEDNSLLQKANEFLVKAKEDGSLLYLQEKYYGHVDQLNYVGAKTFIEHINSRLPQFEATFKEAGQQLGIDWKLLAAIGYQESHWLPSAISPTGVRGLMMLTRITAKEMGIKNRLDPEQSIRGGAAYFKAIKQRIPMQIAELDRIWMALASYNVGFGHLQDARKITKQNGHDPDNWFDVKKHLPLLQHKQWHSQTRYGYARGWEPVHYVKNIRRYYEVLTWMNQPGVPAEALAQAEDSKAVLADDLPVSAPDIPTPFKLTPPML